MSEAEAIAEVLGGRRVLRRSVHSMADINELVRAGLPVGSAQVVMENFALSQEDLLKPLGISKATLARRQKEPRFRAAESDRLYRIAYIAARAEEVFGGREKASDWLHSPNRALNNETPLSRLDTTIGVRQVEGLLTRIEHGVYS